MQRRLLRFVVWPVLLSLILMAFSPLPAANADNTRAFTVGAQVMNTASDILGAIDPSEATLKRFGTGLGSAVLGISIGEAISDVYNGDVTKGLETFSWAVGETVVGLTALGPLYALGKLATAGSGWALEKFYAYMTDDYYTQYKKLRTDTLWPLIENPKRDQFVAWAKGGRGTFEGQWSVMWADKFARDRFIDWYREEIRSHYSWSERTIGFRLFSAFSQRAAQYRTQMNEVPDQAVLKEYIWRRWEAQVVTEGLQEAAEKIRAQQAERNKGIFVVLTGRAVDPDGRPIPSDRVYVNGINGSTTFNQMGALAPASLRDPERFALGASVDYLSNFDPQSKLTLVGGGKRLHEFTLASVLKSSVPVVKEMGVSYLIFDLGSFQARSPETTVTGQVRLRSAPVSQVKVKALDPRVASVTDAEAGGALAFDLTALGGRAVRLVLEVWDGIASAYRDVAVTVSVPAEPGPVSLDVEVPVPEVTEAASDDAAVAALNQNYQLFLDGKITRDIYGQAANRLENAHPSLAGLVDQYDGQIAGLIDQELQYLRVQGEYFTAKTDELKQKASTVADGVSDPRFALLESDSLAYRAGKVDEYVQLRSRYAAMLEQAAAYKTELEGLQDQYSQALSSVRYELCKDQLRGFEPANYPPEINHFPQNVRMIEATLRPYLDQKHSDLLGEFDKQADRYKAKTEQLLARSAAMKEQVNGSRARVASARSLASTVMTEHQALKERKLFDLTWGMGNLLGTMNGIMTERQKQKEGQEANTDWLTHYENRLPEFYAMASQQLEQMYPILGVTYEATFPAETVEGFMERAQPWMDFEAREWERLAPVRAEIGAMSDAMSTENPQFTGLDVPILGEGGWTDYYNAFTEAERERIKQEGQELFNLEALARDGIYDPAGDAETIVKWIAHLQETGYELKTAVSPRTPGQGQPTPAEPAPADPNIGLNKITFQVDSNIAWVKGQKVEMAAPVPIVNGRAMVPVRLIGEALGASVTWNQQYQEVRYIKGTLNVGLRVGDTLVRVDDSSRSERFFIDPTPMIIESRTYVPVRVVSEALGATVQWVPETRQIVILIP